MIELFLTARFESCVAGAGYFFYRPREGNTQRGEETSSHFLASRVLEKKKTAG